MQAQEQSSGGSLHPGYRPPRRHLPVVQMDKKALRNASPQQKKRMAAGVEELRRRAAQKSFGAFMEYVFADPKSTEPLRQQWFHDEWDEAWSTHPRVSVIAPRDHGKTTQVVGRTLFELGNDTNLRIKIGCASDPRAMERLFEIRQHLETNRRLHKVFPGLEPDHDAEWSKHRLVVKRRIRHRDASIEAAGINMNVTGGRADLLIADDVVDRRNGFSAKERETVKRAWFADWSNILEPDSRVWNICTLWHKDDLNHILMENPEYKTLLYRVGDSFGSLWPDKWSEERLRTRFREIGSLEFNRAFRNYVVDDENALIRDYWLKYEDLGSLPQFMERLDDLVFFSSYDTAVGVKEHNDYSSGCIIAVDKELGFIYVVDAWHGHLTVGQQAEAVIKEWKKFLPFRILIEKVGQSTLDEWVLNKAPMLRGIVETTSPKVSKFHRLQACTPLMEDGRVIFSSHLNPNGADWSPERGNLIGELTDFPFGRNDDMVDAFSQAVNGARRYFLDAWSPGGENEFSIGTQEDTGYLL